MQNNTSFMLVILSSLLITHSIVQDILRKADSYSACQTIVCFLYGTWSFIAVFTKVRHWILSLASSVLTSWSHLHVELLASNYTH